MADNENRGRNIIANIKENYRQIEKSIVEQLYMRQDLHGTTIGTAREDTWRQVFEMVLPKKFVIEHSVFIIDSNGSVSHEVDLAVLDETYTPYIFRYGRMKFIPIEAVAAVVECKSQSIDQKSIKKWYESIAGLRTSEHSITRVATMIATQAVPTQKSTRPIRILCTMEKRDGKNSDNFQGVKEFFDFVLCAVPGKRTVSHDKSRASEPYIKIVLNQGFENLFAWYKDLNFYKFPVEGTEDAYYSNILNGSKTKMNETKLKSYEVSDENGQISLLTFNFQLNQLLMLINNPMMFPHLDYVKMFNGEEGGKNG